MAGESKLFTTRGLVLKTKPLGERDRFVSLLTPEKGKLSCVAPGARKTKSSLAALVEPFTLAEYFLHRGKSLYTISQAEKITTFNSLREDLTSYTYACYLSGLLDNVVEIDGGQLKDIFSLLYNSLAQLEAGLKPGLVGLAFEFKLLHVLGYSPHLECCLFCGLESSRYYLSLEGGGLVCFSCSKKDHSFLSLSRGSLALARYLIKGSWPGISRLKLTESQYKELAFLTRAFLQRWAGVDNFKAMSFLEKLNSS